MQPSRRATILSVIVFILLASLGVWWYFGFSVDFMRFFAAELTPTPTPTPTATATSSSQVACSPVAQTTTVGQIVQLSAQGGIGGYTWFAPEGVLVMNESNPGMVGVSYSSKGIKKVTVQRTRLVNGVTSQFIDSIACTVIVQ